MHSTNSAARRERRAELRVLTTLLLLACGAAFAPAEAPRIELTFDPKAYDHAFTGRVYLMTTHDPQDDPKKGPDWFRPQPFFALDVSEWRPGEPLVFDPARALGFPSPLAELPAGTYFVQAVMGVNDWRRDAIRAPDNVYSETVKLEHDPAAPADLKITLDRVIPQRELKDTERVRFVQLESKLLSDFHHRKVSVLAAVILPEGYEAGGEQRYPTIYEIPGFGGSAREARFGAAFDPYANVGLEIVRVLLDPEAPTGHHVFADSDNNGPWGRALTEELIPYLERTFRLIPEAGARYLTGGSSGGWSSLWLQVAYPRVFGGVWSLCPDPVDFRAFQNVNIYAPNANHYFNADGSLVECSRKISFGQIFVKNMNDMETVVGRGGQYQSFEAVFSPRGADGRPKQLWDRKTGVINPEVADAWRRYDINLLLRREWPLIGPDLKGRISIIVGTEDTFHLEKAVYLLRDTLAELGSDARVTVIERGTHFLGPAVAQQVASEVAAQFAAFQARRNAP